MDEKPLYLFKSHYSIGRSILTTDLESTPNGPKSIFEIAKGLKLEKLYLVEDGMSGFLEAYKNAEKCGIQLCFGLRLTVLDDITTKNEESLLKESKIVVFMRNAEGYKPLIKLFSKAATDGFYYQPRIDYKWLKELWSESLLLAIPFYDSFLFNNTMIYKANCIPTFPEKPVFFVESHDLPFDPLIEGVVRDYCKKDYDVIKTHSVYYERPEDAKAHCVFRCISSRSTLDSPRLNHHCSDKFCIL